MCKPIISNGVVEFVTAPDLLDRSIVVPVTHIRNRQTEASLNEDFASKKGRILGAVLDCMVKGVSNLATTKLKQTPRMADCCRWCVACGLEDFEDLYAQNRVDATLLPYWKVKR